MVKEFWKTYRSDWIDHTAKVVVLAVVLVIIGCFVPFLKVVPFALGYILMDPLNYYFVQYRPQKKMWDEIKELTKQSKSV